MRVAILSGPADLSGYVAEMLKTWGLAMFEMVGAESLGSVDAAEAPVLICPASEAVERHGESLVAFARRGGTVVCCLPAGELAAAAGLRGEGEKDGPLRLRLTDCPAAGLAGEMLPVVGRARTYRHTDDARPLGYLCHPGRYHGESVGMTETRVGEGGIVAFAFDLPLCVLMLRQGDPARAEVLPDWDPCARPSHMAADLGPNDSGWAPFADLLCRLLVDVVRRHLPAPAPMLWHLPGPAAGILLYSGDEDNAETAWNDEEMNYVAAAGGRMNLYVIPTATKSTKADVRRYLVNHDIGPHPNLRALDGRPVPERLGEFERQIRMFQDTFDLTARTLRNHCTAWAGYMEPVEVMEKLGVRMDANYFSGTYARARDYAPYAGFGAAMPMRFCRPDGRVLDVFQQHTHIADDVMFSDAEYSYKFSPAQFEVQLRRIFSDIATRFHTSLAVCIHPGGWVKYSRPQGQALLRQAAEFDLPIWSFDEWLAFWEARDTWRFGDVTWESGSLIFKAEGQVWHDRLRLALPAQHAGRSLGKVQVDGKAVPWRRADPHGRTPAMVSVPAGSTEADVTAEYA